MTPKMLSNDKVKYLINDQKEEAVNAAAASASVRVDPDGAHKTVGKNVVAVYRRLFDSGVPTLGDSKTQDRSFADAGPGKGASLQGARVRASAGRGTGKVAVTSNGAAVSAPTFSRGPRSPR